MRITAAMIVRRAKRKNYRTHDTQSDYQSFEIVSLILDSLRFRSRKWDPGVRVKILRISYSDP